MSSPAIEFRNAIREIIDEALFEAEVWSTCLHCVHFREHDGEVCVLATPPARPPAKIIAFGCTAFQEVGSENYGLKQTGHLTASGAPATVVMNKPVYAKYPLPEQRLNAAQVRVMMEYDDDIPF